MRIGLLCIVALLANAAQLVVAQDSVEKIASDATETRFLAEVRQLTLDGRRSGEGYFSADGKRMVFQSERQSDNPFYQIYLMDLETGDVERISDGTGKTTCAWVHPDGKRVLFAGTQDDPARLEKQKTELDFRASGQERRYSWDYDPTYELYAWSQPKEKPMRLTDAVGYDAEASYSPDGKQIVFASNRAAYPVEQLSADLQKRFAEDPSLLIDLYIMDADGKNVRRLTDSEGYDGGPFFSPDGKRICWRRFAPNGATAEVYTMKTDGSDVQRLTELKAMSWAPYYHPSGDYLIFTTNIHGFGNFELYLVRADGKGTPVRVTSTEGFDGLPVFSPDGKQLAWTSGRTANKQSQIFLAKWNDAAARQALQIDQSSVASTSTNNEDRTQAKLAARETAPDFAPTDIMRHVDYLCRPELGGRLTGTPGEQRATAYVAAFFENLGLEPAGENNSFFHEFAFTAGVELGPNNRLVFGDKSYEVDKLWRPLAFSARGEIDSAPIAFAGYGIVTPDSATGEPYDSYVHLDVEGKWVMVFRGLPNDITPERRQELSTFSSLRFKAMAARDRGAKGLIVVSGPTAEYKERIVPLKLDGAMAGTSISVISVDDALATEWMQAADKNLEQLQKRLDDGSMMMGFDLIHQKLSANIDITLQQRKGRNVLAKLPAPKQSTGPRSMIMIGAHIDHLGQGASANSLARDEEREGIHRGADDNASGVAGMLEMAQYLVDQKSAGRLNLQHDLVFAAWSGEELGLLGSAAYAEAFYALNPQFKSSAENARSLYPAISCCLNLDMIGRLRDNLVMQGIGSSPVWKGEIEKRNVPVGLSLVLQTDSYLPTDASTFFLRGVPILSAFTGSHSEYHTPRDVPETLNYEGAAKTARLMALIARSLAASDKIPEFTPQQSPENQPRGRMTAYLGTIPDYASEDVKGVKLNGVAKEGPAEKGGVRGGDIIVELAGRKIENIYDYTYAIEGLRVGTEVEIVVQRNQDRVRLQVTPSSRE